jgi:hypothetical protein
MIHIDDRYFKGFIQEKTISAVWAEKERISGHAWKGEWKVMLRSDGQVYIFCHSSEQNARDTVEEIFKHIISNE